MQHGKQRSSKLIQQRAREDRSRLAARQKIGTNNTQLMNYTEMRQMATQEREDASKKLRQEKERGRRNYSRMRTELVASSSQGSPHHDEATQVLKAASSHSSLPTHHKLSEIPTLALPLPPPPFVGESETNNVEDRNSMGKLTEGTDYLEVHAYGTQDSVSVAGSMHSTTSAASAASAASNHTAQSVRSTISHASLRSAHSLFSTQSAHVPASVSANGVGHVSRIKEEHHTQQEQQEQAQQAQQAHAEEERFQSLVADDTWKDDLEQHQIQYMASLKDPGIFTAELLRQKDQLRLEKLQEKQAMMGSTVQIPIELGDLLSLDNVQMTPFILNQVCRNLHPHSGATLCELSLDQVNLQDTMVQNIATALETNTHLTHLSVARNDLTSQGIVSVAKALRKSTTTALRSLNVAHNDIGDRGVAALSAILHDTALQAIDFTAVGAGDIGAKHLALALSVKRKRKDNSRPRLPIFPRLAYANNQLTPDGLLYFASCTAQNKSICCLCLDGNVNLGEPAASVLSDLLHCFTSLTEVSVQNIGLTRAGASTLLAACEGSDSVRTVHLGCNNEIDDLQQISILATAFQIGQLSIKPAHFLFENVEGML